MTIKQWRGAWILAVAAGVGVTMVGCGPNRSTEAAPASSSEKTVTSKQVDDHSAWWCAEHGVPEEVCGQCSAKYAAECKKNKDWCKEHDRPESQCFICHPDLKEKFAAQYRAKYGKEPPPIESGEQSSKDDDKKGEKR